MKEKFSFSIEFQLEIIRYLIQSKDSENIILKIKPEYLTLIEHSVIVEGLVNFYKKQKKIPSQSILKEVIKELLETRDYVDLVSVDDIPKIYKLINNLYKIELKDSDFIRDKITQFISYIEMKLLIEKFDLLNFNQYGEFSNKVNVILTAAKVEEKGDVPLAMVNGVVDRQLKRQTNPSVMPTPFRQINELSNGGGYPAGSVIVLLDKAKARKTFSLINISRGYLKLKRNVLYIDTENGKDEIMGRMIQSTLNKTKLELQTGDFDNLERKHIRKYKRLGVEFFVERVSAMVDDCNTIRQIINNIETKTEKKINVLIIDYAAKLNSIQNRKEDVERLNNVYIEIQNLALDLNIDAVWTANHITREGSKHKATRYEENDIASGISIVRNVQAIWGLNSTDEEENNNTQRFELVAQRDGKPQGRALFTTNLDSQRMVEFTKSQRELYNKEYGSKVDDMIKKPRKREGNGDI